MRFSRALFLGFAVGFAVMAVAKPLASVSKFDGKFRWVRIGPLPAVAAHSLAHEKTAVVEITFPRAVPLKKDARGNAWFTIILADQGADWKWHQTTVAGTVPTVMGAVKAGHYRVSIPLAGIPASVLTSSSQTISLGPAASGCPNPASFTIDSIH